MKKLFQPIIIILLFISMAIPTSTPTFADDVKPSLLVDEAKLLTQGEFDVLKIKLESLSEKLDFDIVVVTVDDIGNKTSEAFADDYFDYNGYGRDTDRDGVLLLVSMAERDWHISTSGYGITALTDAGLEYIEDEFLSYLSEGEYYTGFEKFASLTNELVTKAKAGNIYDVGSADYNAHNRKTPKSLKFDFSMLLTAIVFGGILALICLLIAAGSLKSVRHQVAADSYVRKNSFKLTMKKDIFLYTTVNRVARPKDTSSSRSGGSSTHRSSSGRSHGGRGGKF